MSYVQILKNPEYDFLRNNPHLGNKICLLGVGGSIAYGTNIPDKSDVDIRGVAVNSPTELLGLSSFDNFVEEATDTTVYSLNKIFKLLLNCNPNTVELLGLKPEHYLYVDDIGQEILDNKHLFLSQRAIYSFGGYATAQTQRLKNNLSRYQFSQSEKELHIFKTIQHAMSDLNSRYQEYGADEIKLYIAEAIDPEMDTEIFMDINLKHYPLRDYKSLWSEMNNIVKDYAKLGKRNKKKTIEKLAKHAMHLIRLYMMCIDILTKREIVTYREEEHELLMAIRNEEFMEDGAPNKEFWDLLEEYQTKFEEAINVTTLPEKPDYNAVESLLIQLNQKALERG